MKEKYLLYIDILGYGDLVKHAPKKIDDLFKMIDTLNVHQHDGFKTIAFSDTVLVYNLVDPVTIHDQRAIVMYLCEFAQDLIYKLADKDIFFRALITYDKFVYYNLNNIECYFGDALVNSYLKEKEINGIGLFINKDIRKFNTVFPTTEYDKDLDFVFLLESIESLNFRTQGHLPLDDLDSISNTDEFWSIKFELKILNNIYDHSINHSDIRARSKYLQTYQLYKNRYKSLLTSFEFEGFVPEVINKNHNWKDKSNTYN